MEFSELSQERRTSITKEKLFGESLINILSKRLLMYPAKDLRLEEGGVEPLDTAYMVDLVNSIRAIVAKRQYASNILYVDYKCVTNLEEIKGYNDVVGIYNERNFGDEGKSEEQVLAECLDEYDESFDYAKGIQRPCPTRIALVTPGDYTGSNKNRPSPLYATRVTVQYQIRMDGDLFTLGYVARDMEGKVLYYDEASSKNLTDLIRRSVQRLWGNPLINPPKYSGYFYDGISLLVQGKKTRYCAGNPKPSILNKDEQLRKVSAALVTTEISETADLTLARTVGGAGPIVCIIAWIGFIIYWVNQYDLDTGVFPEGGLIAFLIGLTILTLLSMLVIKWAPNKIYRSASKLHKIKKFL